jgi:galactokinase
VIGNTRFQRALAGSEYGVRRAQCEAGARILSGYYPEVRALRDVSPAMLDAHAADLPPTVEKRCRFIVEENQRVQTLAGALPRGDRPVIRRTTLASFNGARDLYEITVPEMEAMHAAMMGAPGAIGARQAGAGFGGCLVAFVEASEVDDFEESVREAYTYAAGIEPEIYPVRAAPGAGVLRP